MMTKSRYIDEFLTLNVAPALVPYFPNGKEITESLAAFNATRDHIRHALNVQFNTPNVNVYVPCDGHAPRTGAVFATRTRWNVHSIDPVLNKKYDGRLNRLSIHPMKMENFPDQNVETAIIVMVHPHISVRDTILKFKQCQKIGVIVVPCCFKIDIKRSPEVKYVDRSIWSPKNEVSIYVLEGRDISITM